jgi:hypothetical protein
MANTYKWTINALDAKISQDNKDNVVYNIHWGMTASSEDEKFSANSIGTHGIEYDKDNFKAYADLKESDVISWLEDSEKGLDVASLKSGLDKQLELMATPVDITFSNPFAPEA